MVYLLDESVLYAKFQAFCIRYNKTYPTPEEYRHRFDIFIENYHNLEELRAFMQLEERGVPKQVDNDTLLLDVTMFFDLTQEEFENQYFTFKGTDNETNLLDEFVEKNYTNGNETESEKLRHLEETPEAWDWREHGAASPIKHQRTCGACYAFSVVANLESVYYIKYGERINLSEQQIVNCNPLSNGCKGGTLPATFKWLIKLKDQGLGLEKDSRYLSRREVCQKIAPAIKVVAVKYANTKDPDLVADFIHKHGVVSSGINAAMFRFYKGGIMTYNDKLCKDSRLNHAVNIVGYGISRTGVKYWIIRNTWGPDWGEDGYLRVARGTCGSDTLVMSAVIE
jgi:cathepsin F